MSRKDLKFEATKLHFEDLIQRYGNPVIILNLIKVIFCMLQYSIHYSYFFIMKRYSDLLRLSPVLYLLFFYAKQTREKRPRETILRAEFANAIDFINKDLPEDNRLRFLHWDLNKHPRMYAVAASIFDVSCVIVVLILFICRTDLWFHDNVPSLLQQSYKGLVTSR